MIRSSLVFNISIGSARFLGKTQILPSGNEKLPRAKGFEFYLVFFFQFYKPHNIQKTIMAHNVAWSYYHFYFSKIYQSPFYSITVIHFLHRHIAKSHAPSAVHHSSNVSRLYLLFRFHHTRIIMISHFIRIF